MVTTKQGRVFLISDPRVGSSRTHQTSPRFGSAGPWLGDIPADRVKLFFNGFDLGIAVGNLARPGEFALPFCELGCKRFSQVAGPVARRNLTHKPSC
ncbi:MAG: hypothetical protein ACRD18_02855 [Terriglobia bacterium]